MRNRTIKVNKEEDELVCLVRQKLLEIANRGIPKEFRMKEFGITKGELVAMGMRAILKGLKERGEENEKKR